MAEIRPFRGIRYNQEIVKNLAGVICPPYDIITPQQQKHYYERSDYNAIQLEHPLTVIVNEARQSNGNKYSRAAITFQQWLKKGILQVDDYPAFYLHDHYFTHLGVRRRRRGLMARVRLKPWGNGIYPHEETFSKAKSDRLQLMRACQANFSSLFALYQDSSGEIGKILSEASQDKPIIELTDSGESHVVWAITEPKFTCQISELLVLQPLYIADGHHRYETALAYQQERISGYPYCGAQSAEAISKKAFNYVMMTLVNFSDPGLVIFPIHRLVRGVAPSALAGLRNRLENFFTLEFIPLTENFLDPYGCGEPKSRAEALSEAKRQRKESEAISKIINEALLGILGLEPQSLVLVRQRHGISFEDVIPKNHSQAYKNFNVSFLNHIILGRMLGMAQVSENIAYIVDINEACQQIKEKKYQLAFLLSPPQLEMVKAIADAKDRMPRKSTYFYPKLPTGLVINPLD
jgi:uncharacterized protein (DUF1015 family)